MDDLIRYPSEAPVAIVNGKLLPVGGRQTSAMQVLDQIKTVVCLMYEGEDPRLKGMTLMEAALVKQAIMAADGDGDALERFLNRILGKPLQQVANLNMNASLKEYLDELTRSDASPADDVDPFDE